MPNPRAELIAIGEDVAVQGAAKLGLLDVAGVTTKSLLQPEVAGVVSKAIATTGDDVAMAIMSAGKKSGIPMGVDIAKIGKVSESLAGGSTAQTEGALADLFRPRTYSEMMAFYGG